MLERQSDLWSPVNSFLFEVNTKYPTVCLQFVSTAIDTMSANDDT